MAKQVWMVRAGRDSVFIDEFLSRQMIAIGWSKLGDLSNVHSREQISQLVEQFWPENNKFQNSASVGQVYRFREEIVPGATVVTYDSNHRIYHLGAVTGDYAYHPEYDPELVHTKAAKWDRQVSRDVLSAGTKNSLGSISTIFCLSAEAAEELLSSGQNGKTVQTADSVDDETEGETEIRRDTEERALGFLQDKLSKLDWAEMQELVAEAGTSSPLPMVLVFRLPVSWLR
jgi:restriction system protein